MPVSWSHVVGAAVIALALLAACTVRSPHSAAGAEASARIAAAQQP